MAKINTPEDLFIHFLFTEDCKITINQLYNTYKEVFLKPLAGICGGIKRQSQEILKNEYEHPTGIFYVKTCTIKVVYKKETLEIISVSWVGKKL